MKIDDILKKEIEIIKPDKKELNSLKREVNEFILILREEIERKKINADVFVGGSFAKGTLIKKGKYDVDIFLRFDFRLEHISNILEDILQGVKKKIRLAVNKIHGSRDYFQIEKKDLVFELIPVYKIKKPREARNVMDLSYFHINYAKRKLKDKMKEQVLLSKQFCHAQKVYGAESYIGGFSGYGLECLIIHYKSFLNMLKDIVKIKERKIIDPQKFYKKTEDVLFSLNESRLQSPLILVDPIWKERNVLAALSKSSFEKFQKSAREFLIKPSLAFFQISDFNENKFKNSARESEFLHLTLKTNKQEGDIAGTKMKKFSEFIEKKLSKYFDMINKEFIYSEGQEAEVYLIVKSKKELVLIGPPVNMLEHANAFKKKHKEIFEKAGFLHAREKINFSAREFLNRFIVEERKTMKDMGIVDVKIRN